MLGEHFAEALHHLVRAAGAHPAEQAAPVRYPAGTSDRGVHVPSQPFPYLGVRLPRGPFDRPVDDRKGGVFALCAHRFHLPQVKDLRRPGHPAGRVHRRGEAVPVEDLADVLRRETDGGQASLGSLQQRGQARRGHQ